MLEELVPSTRSSQLSFDTTASFGQDSQWWSSYSPDLVIINLPDDDLLLGFYFTKLRKDVPKNQALIFLAPNVSGPLLKLTQEFSRVRFLKTPVSGKGLLKIVLEITKDYEEGKNQQHPRYMTNQKIEVSCAMKLGLAQGIMKNLSLGGVFLELAPTTMDLQKDDIIKLKILLEDGARSYEFDAKIRWIKKEKEALTLGASFADKEEVFNNLLKSM